ncbi:MAG: carbohydrate-binding protein, partial [Pseudomonadota bacterium]
FPGPDAPGFTDGVLTVLAANFDDGGQDIAYNDAPGLQGGGDGGRPGSDVEVTGLGDIGWIADGEWLEYTVDVPAAGLYNTELLMAFGAGGARSANVDFYRPGEDTPYASLDPVANPNTGGWTVFETRDAGDIDLEGGVQIVRITFNGGSQDIRSFTLEQLDTVDPNQAPVATAIADASVEEGTAIALDVSGSFSDPDGDTLGYSVAGLAGLSISAAGVITGTAPQVGADTDATITVTASDGEFDVSQSFTLTVEDVPVTTPDQTPFPGPDAPVLVDALTIDATNFDAGGQGVAWNDTPGLNAGQPARTDTDVELVGGQLDIGYIEAGEWVEYTIDVAEAGTYDLSLTAKTPIGGNTIAVSLEDGPDLATFSLVDANGAGDNGFGGTDFSSTDPIEIALGAGEQTLRFTFDGSPATNGFLMDFRSFDLEKTDDPVVTEPELIGEAGNVTFTQTNSDTWFAVSFAEALENPSVIMGPPTVNGAQQTTMRVRDVTSDGFEFQLDEWDYLDGGHIEETVSWMAIEAGVHSVDGLTIAAGIGTADAGSTGLGFGTSFSEAPTVLAQVTTTNDAAAVTDRVQNVSGTGFSVELDNQESTTGSHPSEALSWIAVEQGGSADTGLVSGATGNVVTHLETTANFGGSFDGEDFAFLADMQTEDGNDPATTRLAGLDDVSATFFIEEEASDDTETNHTTEDVGYTAILSGQIFADDIIA